MACHRRHGGRPPTGDRCHPVSHPLKDATRLQCLNVISGGKLHLHVQCRSLRGRLQRRGRRKCSSGGRYFALPLEVGRRFNSRRYTRR